MATRLGRLARHPTRGAALPDLVAHNLSGFPEDRAPSAAAPAQGSSDGGSRERGRIDLRGAKLVIEDP